MQLRTDGRTLLEPSYAERSDREETTEPKVVGVHATEQRPWFKQGSCIIIVHALAIEICSLILTREPTGQHSWNQVYRHI